jgi:predicted CXXCH cytochrome family protein
MIQIMYGLVPAGYDENMKNVLLVSSAVLVLLCAVRPAQAACTVCHSKNPKMVSMHKALQYKDCFKCHGPASDRKTPNARDEMTTDPLCVNCHAAETTNVKE